MSEEMAKLNEYTSEEYIEYLSKNVLKNNLIYSINLNNKPTTVEKMLAAPSIILHKKMPKENYPWSSVDPSNTGLSGKHTWNAHYLAMKALHEELGEAPMQKLGISKEARNLGKKWIGKYAKSFYDNFYEREGKTLEDYNPSINKLDFDDTMLEWKREAEKDLNKFIDKAGEGVRDYITLAFLDGVATSKGFVKEINHIPSVDLLSHRVLKAYKNSWKNQRSNAPKTTELMPKTEAASILDGNC